MASVWILTVFLIILLYNVRTAPRLSRPPSGDGPRVKLSVLIPARNEVVNISKHLSAWIGALRPGDELLILDDQSTDGTAELARARGARVIAGRPTPPGWLGKSWACHQLAGHATNEVLVFVDADVWTHPNVLNDTARWFESGTVDALSALSRQTYFGFVDRATVPFVMHLPIMCTLPLNAVLRAPYPILSAASGLWIAITRDAYERIGGHAAVKGDVTEDVLIGRLVKRHKLKLVYTLAADRLTTSMYGSWRELRDGFGRSMFALCDRRAWIALAIGALHTFAFVLPWALAWTLTPAAWIAAALLITTRLIITRTTGGQISDLLLHPLGSLIAVYLLGRSAVVHWQNKLTWRDRLLSQLVHPGGDAVGEGS